MNIKLITPKMTLRPMDSEFKRMMAPSLGLLTVAALTPAGHDVYLEDENIGNIHFSDRPDVVGITVNVDTAHRAYSIADKYREKGIIVVLGGIHVSANPDEALNHADAVCIGEATEVWGKILEDIQNNCLKKKYQHQTREKTYRLPIPRWDLLDEANYLYTNIIATSRGCPYKCTFCYNSSEYAGHTFRNRDIDNVLAEIKALPTKHIMFIDDNLIGNIEWCKKFVQKLKPLNIKWQAAVSANIGLHTELLDAMKESGCRSLFIGFETINKKSLYHAAKYQNKVDSYEKTIEEIHKRGIMVNASIVFGFDEDGPEVFHDTVNWLITNRIETMTAHILTPYPGTKLFHDFKAAGRIIDFDWSHYNTAHVVYKPLKMTSEELYEGYLWSYREFYSCKNIIKRVPKSEQIIPHLLFNFGYRKFGKITAKIIASLGLMHTLGKVSRLLSHRVK